MGSLKGGRLEEEGGGYVQEQNINREFQVQSKSKMMSFSQKYHSIISNQLKTAKKERERLVFVCS